MGYTHYMRGKPAFTDAQWKQFCEDVSKLLNGTTIPVAGAFGNRGSLPHVGKNDVSFNGVEDDSHETCYIPKKGENFIFCKTAEKPYDVLVVEVFKLVRKYLPSTKLSSDGGDEVFAEIEEPRNVVVVKSPSGKKLTYSAGNFRVAKGDAVLLPPPPFNKYGDDWTAKVIATESDYKGPLVEILGVVSQKKEHKSLPIKPMSLKDEIAGIIMDHTKCNGPVAYVAAENILIAITDNLNKKYFD